MARPQTYEPIIVEELQAAGEEGMTRQELAEAAGCSLQQVHKIVKKSELDPDDPHYLPIKVIGQGRNGAQILAWDREAIVHRVGPKRRAELNRGYAGRGQVRTLEPVKVAGAGTGDEMPALGERLQVTGMEMVDGAVVVKVRDEQGRVLEFTRTVDE